MNVPNANLRRTGAVPSRIHELAPDASKMLSRQQCSVDVLRKSTFLFVGLLFALSGCAGETSEPTTAAPVPAPSPIVAPPPPPPAVVLPTASFSRTPTSGSPPLTAQFTDTSVAGSEPITAWLWDFGDGATSDQQNPTHIYATDGSYEVSLRVTTAVGSDEKISPDSVVVTTALPARIIESVGGGGSTPALPEPDVFGAALPERSEELLVNTYFLQEFNPVVTRARLTSWTGTNPLNDCRVGTGMNNIPEPANPAVAFRTSIPRRNTTHLYTTKYVSFFNAFNWAGQGFPRNLLLIGKYRNPADSINNGKSFDLGGVVRWESCEENTPFLRDFFTSYVLSYNQRLAEWPRLRHYKVWRRLRTINVSGDNAQSINQTWTYGVAETTTQTFTESITATAGVTGGPYSAELSATLSQSYSNSVTVEVIDTLNVPMNADSGQKLGYSLQYTVWFLEDIFRIEGSVPGRLWSDPNYELAPNQLEISVPSRSTSATQSAWFLRP